MPTFHARQSILYFIAIRRVPIHRVAVRLFRESEFSRYNAGARKECLVASGSEMKKSGHDSSPRIAELDGLRGLATLLVILCHYVGNPDHSPLGFLPHRFLLAFTAG